MAFYKQFPRKATVNHEQHSGELCLVSAADSNFSRQYTHLGNTDHRDCVDHHSRKNSGSNQNRHQRKYHLLHVPTSPFVNSRALYRYYFRSFKGIRVTDQQKHQTSSGQESVGNNGKYRGGKEEKPFRRFFG